MNETQSHPKRVAILGTRGIPARYGGFETFAEHLAIYLVERGWDVTVYCPDPRGDLAAQWRGVRLRGIPVGRTGALGSVVFDLKSTLIAARGERLVLNLGYGTSVFAILLRLAGCANLINMDGLEWKREKWSYMARRWLQANEWIGGKLGHHLIADHPGIEDHLSRHTPRSKITMIPYGADRVEQADEAPVRQFGLIPGRYALIIGRAEPENSILTMVRAFSAAPRGKILAVLGNYDDARNAYQREVLSAAGPEVRFLGAIYEPQIVQSLRFHTVLYLHGHQVGGTNPSLVEALGAGNAVLAHDNHFNRWVAGPAARYFSTEIVLRDQLDELLNDGANGLTEMREGSRKRHAESFSWDGVLAQYEQLLARWHR